MKPYILIIMIVLALTACSNSQTGVKDEHGCLIESGYRYCPSKEECVLTTSQFCDEYADHYKSNLTEFYKNDDEKKAIQIARAYAWNMQAYKQDHGRRLRVLFTNQSSCEGCYAITLQYNVDSEKELIHDKVTTRITMENWMVNGIVSARETLKTFTSEECKASKGRVVTSGDCLQTEFLAGNVSEVNLTGTCCIKKKVTNFKECVDAGYEVLESYPRQCTTGDGTYFREVLDDMIRCPEDMKECPDGSFVSRVPPDCAFKECPI